LIAELFERLWHVSKWKTIRGKLLIIVFLILPLSIAPVFGNENTNIILPSSGTITYNSSQPPPTPPPTPTLYTFGNTAVGTLTNSFSTDKDASRFQLTQSGVLQSISAYFGSAGFNAKAAIYTDNNGAPSTLIAQSSSQAVTASGWKTFTVPESFLTSGYYWLCVVSSSYSLGAMTSTSTNSHAWKTTSYSGEFASAFGTPSGYEKTATSIYATYTATTSIPNSTPTPNPSSTPTPIPPGETNEIKMLRYVWAGLGYDKSAQEYAENCDIFETFYPWYSAVDYIKSYNPNIIVLLYDDLPFTLSPNQDNGAMTNMFIQNNWILKDASGNYVTSSGRYMWDIGNSDAQAYKVNWFAQQIAAHPSLDGVRFDDFNVNTGYFINFGENVPINPRTGNTWVSQDICDAVLAFMDKVKQTTDKLIFINGGVINGDLFFDSAYNPYWTQAFASKNIDGLLTEGLFEHPFYTSDSSWVTEAYWKKSLDYLVWLGNNWMMNGDKYQSTAAENIQVDLVGLPSFLPSGATAQQFMTFQFASALLGSQNNYPCIQAAVYTFNDFYQSLFNKNISQNLGNPIGSYSMITNTHVYSRQFSSGLVLVNPTSTPYTVNIGSGYTNAISGTSEPAYITVQAHTGIILLRF
jgi:hypothetical protein